MRSVAETASLEVLPKMHIDKWVKTSVVVAIVMGIPGWIGVFGPNSFSKHEQEKSSIVGSDTETTTKTD